MVLKGKEAEAASQKYDFRALQVAHSAVCPAQKDDRCVALGDEQERQRADPAD